VSGMHRVNRIMDVVTGAEARAEWQRIADAVPQSVGRLPVWTDLVCASGRFVDATRAYRRPDGRVLVLPLVRRRSTPGPLALYESPPHGWELGADSGGLVSDGPVTAQDVEAVAADLAELPAARVRVWPGTTDRSAWLEADLPHWLQRSLTMHVVDLPGPGGPPVLDTLSRNTVKRVRKGERFFEVEHDDSGRLLPVFQDLLRRSVDVWAEQHWLPTPAARQLLVRRDPPGRRADLVRRMGGVLRVWVASEAGRPVGAIVVVSHGPTAAYWGGATDKRAAGNRGAGQLLHARALEAAVAEGRRHYDMGSSGSPDQVTFKESMGAHPVDVLSMAVEHLPVTSTEATLRGGLRTALTGAARARRALAGASVSAAG
jgi:Acetyltransferase (GNAT) domain